jgi:signal peptidase I
VAYFLVASIVILGVPLFLRAYWIEAFRTPSGSMAPTLLDGDHFWVGKQSKGKLPQRGDVIVFQDPSSLPAVDYVKRAVGLPGDRIEFLHGQPVVNGTRVPRCLVGTFTLALEPNGPTTGELYLEQLGTSSHLAWYEEGLSRAHQGPFVVPDGEVFVIGDNRWNSSDSRNWNGGAGGTVPLTLVKGRALSVWFSMDSSRQLRWDRIGLSLRGTPALPGVGSAIGESITKCLSELPRGAETR